MSPKISKIYFIHTVDKRGPKKFSVLDWFGFGSNKKHQVTIELTGSSTGM